MKAGVLRPLDDLAILPLPLDRHACGNLSRRQPALDQVLMMLDQAAARREHKSFVALGASKLPLAKRVEHHRRQGNRALAGLRLRLPDRAVAVGALADVKLALIEVDVVPTQAAQFRSPQ